MECIGALMLALGFVGVFLPVLPTTPFVLAAAFCFSANPRIYGRIRDSRYFGEYLRAYSEGAGLSTMARARGIAVTWAVLLASMLLAREDWLRTMLAVIGVLVTLHLMLIARNR